MCLALGTAAASSVLEGNPPLEAPTLPALTFNFTLIPQPLHFCTVLCTTSPLSMRDSTFSTFLGKICISSCHTLEPRGVDVVRCGAPLRPRVPAPPAPILAIAPCRTNSPLLFYHRLQFYDFGTHVRARRTTQRSPEKTHHSSSLSASAATADTKSFPPAQLTFVKFGDISASNGIIPWHLRS